MTTATTTLFIGLDGATFTILDPLMAAGQMPRLAALVRTGVRAVLNSTVHPLTPPAWTSVMTGRSPGNHGILDFYRPESADARVLTIATARDVRCETVWQIANRYEQRVITLNFPMMSPPRPIDGVVIPGWVPWRHLRMSSRPAGLFDQFKSIAGFDPRSLTVDLVEEGRALEGMGTDDAITWVREHVHRESLWHAITKTLMRDAPAPLTAVLFDGTDKIQHLCYRLLDPALQQGDYSPQEQEVREEATGYYRELDRFIGDLVDQAGPQARVVIASDHGFGPWRKVFHLNAWLHQHGYLHWTEQSVGGGNRGQEIPGELGLDAPRKQAYLIDWDRTIAYGISVSGNGIRIRRAGDQGMGVAPEDYEQVRRAIADGLRAVRDPETGELVVRQVLTNEEAFPGAASPQAPDLTVLMQDYGLVSLLNRPNVVRRRSAVFGTHYPAGIFIAAGPGIRSGAVLPDMAIVDVAPTLLYSLGIPVPANFEGAIPQDAFVPEFLAQYPPRPGPPTLPQASFMSQADKAPMSESDEAEMMRRLGALGYVES